MKIKKLIAGSLAALTAGMGLIAGGFAATTFNDGLKPFVKVTDSTLSSPVIVVGANANPIDIVAATDLAASLVSHYAVTQKVVPSAVATASVSDGVLLDSSLNKAYIGEDIKDVKGVLTETDLPNLLKSYEFTDKNSTTSKYTQKIVMGSLTPTFSVPSGETEPYLHIPITTTTNPYNITITFIGGLDPTAVDTTYTIKLFGKEFTFGNTHTNTSLELYSSAGAQVLDLIGAGDEKQVTVEGNTFTIRLNGWDSSGTTAYLSINGQSYPWPEGSTQTVSGVKFYVQSVDVIYTGAQEAKGQVKLFVGTDKLLLNHGQQITRNDVTKNTYVYFSSPSANKINSITFEVHPEDDVYVTEDQPFVDPVFGSFKLVLKDMTPAITDASRDVIKLTADSSNVKLTFTNKDGIKYNNVPVIYGSGGVTYQKINNLNFFRTKECNVSVPDGNITKGDYFVVSSGEYSYILKYTGYTYDASDPTKTYVTITDVGAGTNYKVYPNAGEQLTIGSLSFPIQWNADKTICVSLNGDGDYAGDTVTIKTKTGAVIATNEQNVTITETPLYTISGSNEPTPASFKTIASHSTTTGIRFTTTPSALQVGSANEWKYMSDYGSYVHLLGDNNGVNSVTYYYPGERPAYVNVAMGENPIITLGGGTAGGTYNAAVPITNPIAKLDNEVSTTALANDLVLVGGPCANTLVKQILNEAWNTADSCDYWLTQHPQLKNNGYGLVKIVENVFGSGKKALIVAGTTGADTRALVANKVIKPNVFANLDTDEYIGPVQ
ncbi:MAG: S-layer protein [Candidatus Aenigmatarchaeota archaeon]